MLCTFLLYRQEDVTRLHFQCAVWHDDAAAALYHHDQCAVGEVHVGKVVAGGQHFFSIAQKVFFCKKTSLTSLGLSISGLRVMSVVMLVMFSGEGHKGSFFH